MDTLPGREKKKMPDKRHFSHLKWLRDSDTLDEN
jgi:hypothetical protein